MSLLNYTTTISPEKTGSEIQKKLAGAGAQSVLFEYKDGIMDGISFRLRTSFGDVYFKLPTRRDGVLKILQSDKKVPKKLKTDEQANRVAWRILKDWIEAQVALVEVGMVEMSEVFLPYAQGPDGSTFFEKIKENKFKMLSGGSRS